ncbi:MAG: hypothetical protein DWQ34_08665 [Planctomycetota bacterium]|nr:MAG: hypothetical protein DWQ34_08665 [Planctomycetota bacterium]
MPSSITCPNELTYHGAFSGTVGQTDARVCGDARVTFEEDGLEITVSIRASSASDRTPGEAYGAYGMLRPSNRIKWNLASVETADGFFRITDRPFLRNRQLHFGGGDQTEVVKLGGLRAVFDVKDSKAPKYWLLPIYNLLWDSRLARFDELNDHPMWIGHNRDDGEWRVFPPPVIRFEFDGAPAFIQRVSEYDVLKKKLQNGGLRRAITAVMVGEIGVRSFGFPQSDPASWFPMHILSWLTLASGRRLGSPWIELYDADGQLVRRVHVPFGRPDFRGGMSRIDNVWHPHSVGHLLTRALECEEFGQATTALPLLLVNESVATGGSLEYRKVQLSRAFELLAQHLDLHVADRLIDEISDPNKSDVNKAISDVSSTLHSIAVRSSAAERRALERMAQRIKANAAGKENDFGSKVSQVAQHFGFADANVLDEYFKSHPMHGNSTWAGVLSMFRGAVMHEGYFALDVAGGRYSLKDAAAVIDHLEDLLIRILLKTVKYEGRYVSMIRGSSTPVELGWVTEDSTPEELGFGVDRSP